MPVTDKNRKILWARSGNRCAICRIVLVVEQTEADSESVVGEECHIVSSAKDGPRHDPDFPSDDFDSLGNLVLLCATHHKMIDDQYETYAAPVVRSLKQNHEMWVETKLRDAPAISEIRRVRFRQNIPAKIPRIQSGKDLFALASNCSAHYFDYDPDLSEEEVELVGGFGEEIADWVDLSSQFGPIENVRTAKRIQDLLNDLEARGFLVFAAREEQRLEGGIGPPQKFPVLHLSVLRKSNPHVQFSDTE
jgi:hypothetical protein